MEFNFPDNKTMNFGTLQNYRTQRGKVLFSDINVLDPKDNLIEIEGVSYFFTYLKGAISGNKGGNSILLKLYRTDLIDTEDIKYEEPTFVLKVSRCKKTPNPKWIKKNERRFLKEIEALIACNDKKFQNIIKIFDHGICYIKNSSTDNFEPHYFYTMEYAEIDLKEFVELRHETLDITEKLNLCKSLCEGLKELRMLGYYHRDIKPDNIFIIGKIWKIGDLGLISERGKESEIDEIGEPIGPRGWMSPESMNKYLCEGKGFSYPHNCNIDHQSDIFQLGKVFWYIFQHNAPLGTVKEKDFFLKNSRIYAIIKTMLNHSTAKRYKDIDEVINLIKVIELKLLKKQVA